MNKYIHYVLSPIFYIGVSALGGMFTEQGVQTWYSTISTPSFTPPGSVIGVIWTIIFILSAISLILFVNRGKGHSAFWPIISLFVLNGIINTAWSYIFFTKHLIGPAVIDALLIAITVGILIVLTWRYSKISSLLLLPYFLWVSFATYLTYAIYNLN